MKIKRMAITEILRRIWLFSATKIKSSESFSKQPTQLIIAVPIVTFFCCTGQHFFYLNTLENFYLVEKQNKKNFMKKIRKLVDSGIVKTCDELDLKVFVPIRQVLRPQPHRFL